MAKATQNAAEQEEHQDTEIIDTGSLMGVLSGTFLNVIAIIRGGDDAIFVNIKSLLIIMGGVLTTDFIGFPSYKPIGIGPILQNAFKMGIYEPGYIICR
jgi:flagellar motor component MotA